MISFIDNLSTESLATTNTNGILSFPHYNNNISWSLYFERQASLMNQIEQSRLGLIKNNAIYQNHIGLFGGQMLTQPSNLKIRGLYFYRKQTFQADL